MKQNFKNMLLSTGIIVILAAVLYSCGGGGGYGGGGGGGAMAPPPGAFSLVSPADNAMGVGTTPMLSWTADPNATDFRVQVDTSGTFTAGSLIINAVESATTYSYSVPSGILSAGTTTYHWRVVAENIYGQSIAGPRTFTP
jgi:hypothetical protein